ncbi:hypothetical protein ACOSQ3_019804 [Xanthoceras sorbifolium]
MTKSNRTLEDILHEFTSQFTGILKEWFQSLVVGLCVYLLLSVFQNFQGGTSVDIR